MSSSRTKKPKVRRTQQCGQLQYTCQHCGHEVELKLSAKGSKEEQVPSSRIASAASVDQFARLPHERMCRDTPDHMPPASQESKVTQQQCATISSSRENKEDANNMSLLSPTAAAVTMTATTAVTATPKEIILGGCGHVFPLVVKIKHNGFWITNDKGKHATTLDESCSRNSIMLDPSCNLYVWKLALRHALLTKGILKISQIDAANLVPHIKVRNDPKDGFSKYSRMADKMFMIQAGDISVRNDFVTIELDIDLDLHFTLVYSKGIKKRTPDLLQEFVNVVALLNQHPELIGLYSSLPYFGEDAMAYWVETSNKYPFNICPPIGWKPAPVVTDQEKFGHFVLSPAGTIVSTIAA